MIPIARDTGTVIAFGGRALEADQQPKYLNSPETPIYTKSRTLYGLNLTKGDLRKGNFALIVEGYFDFAQVYQAGGFPVVATCGTALTSQQAQMLRRFAAEGGALLRPRSRRPDRRRAQLRAAGQRRLRRQRSAAAGRRGSRHVHPEAGARRVRRPAQAVAAVSRVPARSRRGRARPDARRQPARVPDAGCWASRRAFPIRRRAISLRIGWRTRRGSRKRWFGPKSGKRPAARKTELPAERVPTLQGHVRKAEKGLIWTLVHQPGGGRGRRSRSWKLMI